MPFRRPSRDVRRGRHILLSHTPWQAEKAAEAGAGLMLRGHTHGGQIWPFGYLVRRRIRCWQGATMWKAWRLSCAEERARGGPV